MARRYDSGTTTFSPEGRLYQVEYAIAAIQNAAAAVAIQVKGGIVIATEKRVASKLLAPPKSSEKIYTIDDHVFCAVAGLTSDANVLIGLARTTAQRHQYTYGEPQPVESLVQLVADAKHSYTQYGGLRPFGVAFLVGGWDAHLGFQLYQSDPAGNYGAWKATAIGANATSAQTGLRAAYSEDLDLAEATKLAVRILTTAMDTTLPSPEKLEVAVLTREGGGAGGSTVTVHRHLAKPELAALLEANKAAAATAGDV